MAQQDIFAKTVENFLTPIKPFLDDIGVCEIMINGYNDIYIEKGGKVIHTDAQFQDERALQAAAKNIAQYVGKILSEKNPRIDARLPNGSRVHIVIPPVSKGTCLSIRKFAEKVFSMDFLVEHNSLSPRMKNFLKFCTALKKNMMVSGGTSSGKTSLLNALSTMISPRDRILVIEDAKELQFQQPHVVNLEAKGPDKHGRGAVTLRDLVLSALRMRPDRIVIGEVRGAEAMDLLLAMTSGHAGCLSTTHASTPYHTLNRLETLCLMSDIEMPLRAIRAQVASSIDIIVQTNRLTDGSRKIMSIAEVLPLSDSGEYRYKDIFVFQKLGYDDDENIMGKFVSTGYIPTFYDEILAHGYNISQKFFEKGRE